MLYIKSLEQAVPVFKALGSELRIRLIRILLEHNEMNMNELASSLGITNGALTSHVKKLEGDRHFSHSSRAFRPRQPEGMPH